MRKVCIRTKSAYKNLVNLVSLNLAHHIITQFVGNVFKEHLLIAFLIPFSDLCYTPENIPGDCRSIYDCPSILAQFQSRLTNRVSNYLRSLQCQTDTGAYPFVCCAMYNNFQQPNPQTTWLTSVDRNDRTPVTSYSGAGNGGHLPAPGYCGLTSLGNRIYGGEGTQLDEYPWMALLEYRKRESPLRTNEWHFQQNSNFHK